MAYTVPGMTLIPQAMTMSCWYASAQMVIKWKEEQLQQSLARLISPEFDAQCSQIRDAGNNKTELLVYDPWPPNAGKIEWRDMMSWYAMGNSASTRDTGKDVETVFLYVPDNV